MFRFLAIGIDIVSAGAILIPSMLILQNALFHSANWKRKIWMLIFALYLTALFSATGIPAVNSLTFDPSFNWVPFIDIINSPEAYIVNTLLNILLFLPLGCLMPVIWKEYRFFPRTFLFGLGTSIAIELLQIFTFRLTDIDDLIFNAIGTVIGYCAYAFINRFLIRLSSGEAEKTGDTEVEEDTDGRKELLMTTAAAFLAMFLAQPFIAGILWEFIL